MSISRKDFDRGNFNARHIDRVRHPISVLLRENSNLAFNVQEIIKKTRMKEDSVRSMLRTFQKAGLVVHKVPFFAWKENRHKSKHRR